MEKQLLLERLEKVKARFNELSSQLPEINTELNKLQGEYRLIGELIAVFKEPEVVKEKSPRRHHGRKEKHSRGHHGA